MMAKAHPPSLPGVCPRPMVDLGTLAGLRTRDHKLTAYCPLCSHRAALPLVDLVAQGKASLHLPIDVR